MDEKGVVARARPTVSESQLWILPSGWQNRKPEFDVCTCTVGSWTDAGEEAENRPVNEGVKTTISSRDQDQAKTTTSE